VGKNKKFWEVKAAANDVGELYIYGDITSYKWDDTDITAKDFAEDLKALGDLKTLNIYLNSLGGSVFQGQAIFSILKRHSAYKNVYIDGIAASIASVIAMAGDTIRMPKNAMIMIHNPWTFVMGNSADLRKEADALDKIRESMIVAYMDKIQGKTTEEELIDLLDAETWLTAQECFDRGFCDELLEEKQIAASCLDSEMLAKYKNVPDSLKNLQKGADCLSDDEKRRKIIEESRADLANLSYILK
jgi:ATP-dependent Clp protease protease subunit